MYAKKILRACLIALFLSGFADRPAAAGDYLTSEWQVGQERVSGADLKVTPPPEAPEELSIEDAVSAASRYNADFRGTIQSLLSARSNWQTAKQRWNLTLFAGATRTRNEETTNERQAGATLSYSAVTGADFSVTAELSRLDSEEKEQSLDATFRQPLLAGSGKASFAGEELRSARNSYRRALISFFIQRQSLVERVISAYFGAVQQQHLVRIQEMSVSLAQQAVKDASLRLEAGLIPEIDLTRAQLRLAREQTSAIQQRQAMQDSMDNLLNLLGMQVGDSPGLVSTVDFRPTDADMDLQQAVGRSLELRPELRVSQLSIEDRKAALRISRSERLPSLDLFGGWSRTANDTTSRQWDIGLELSVPISSRSLRESERQAEWSLLVAQQDLVDLRQRIISEVRSQVRAAEAARANVEIASQSVEVARKSLHFAQRMVEEGLRTNRDLLDAQDDLTRSETSLITSKINYYLATVRLRRAIGEDISRDLPVARETPSDETLEKEPKHDALD